METDRRIFRNLEDIPRLLPTPYALAEAGFLPDQLMVHRGRVIEALYICIIFNTRGAAQIVP